MHPRTSSKLRGAVLFLILGLFVCLCQAEAGTVSIRSAVVAPGDTVTIPVEITGDVQHVYGFQFDLNITPSSGAPAMTIKSLLKGAAVTTAPDIESNPLVPVVASSIRIGLPNVITQPGSLRPEFSGPGSVVWIEMTVPANASVGQTYDLDLGNVFFAGPGNLALPLEVFGGAITVGSTTALADSVSYPQSMTITEGIATPLVVTVTAAGQAVSGMTFGYSVDDASKASFSSPTAVSGADGKATVNVTGLKGGSTVIRISASGFAAMSVSLTVMGVSPTITSTPLLEVKEGATYTYAVTATDPNGDVLTYSLLKSPTGMTINPNTGLITWTPPAGQPQSGNDVKVQASDPQGHTDTQSFSIWIVVDADGDGYDNRVDCDDHNPAVHPGAVEICNGIDDNCNGQIDEGVIPTFYRDADGDGYGDPNVTVQVCTAPPGYVANNADCDDTDPLINPSRKEIGDNGIDEDCNPSTPDNWSRSFIAAIDDGGVIYYAKSNGNGTFSNYKSIWDIGAYNSRAITINDFNNDGYLDILAGGGVNGRVDYYLFLNDGNDNFSNQGIVLSRAVTEQWAMDMASGDINNDGNIDFIAGANSGQIIIALGDGKGGFTSSMMDLGGYSRGLDIADFNNDGNLDFVRGRNSDGVIYVALGKGDGTFNAAVSIGTVGTDPYGVTAADFDNDGNVDIIADTGSGGDPYWFKGKGDGTFTSAVYIASLDANNHVAYDAYDFNNDGNVDVIVSDYSGLKIWFYPGNGNGTFGARTQINSSNTSNNVLAVSAPPYRTPGAPFAIIKPKTQTITPGGTASFDGSASKDNGSITAWNWTFGDGGTGTGSNTSHAYGTTEGVYNVVLKVTDDSGKKTAAAAKVNVQGAPPVAKAGGPYTFGETYANAGLYTVMLDGSGSTDDSGISKYEWDFGYLLSDTFDGTTVDTTKWIASSGLTQSGTVSFVGTGSWGGRYLFSQGSYLKEAGLTFEAKVKPVNTTGNQYGMFGFKNTNSTYTYTQMPYAVYFNNGAVYIYEDNNSRGQVTSYTRGQDYDVKIVLKSTGATYYLRKTGDLFWTLIYDSSYAGPSSVKVGTDVSSGTFTMDDARVSLVMTGQKPTRLFNIGSYPVTLTVTDAVGQKSSDSTTINVVPGNPPAPNPGGPYYADETDAVGGQWFIALNGSGSTDDVGIIRYEWDFDSSNGIQVDSTSVNPTRMYDKPGTYTVTLSVTDNALQTRTATTQVVITTSGVAPDSEPGGPYAVNEESVAGGVWTTFVDGCGSSDDVNISRYVWDFGDGSSATTYYCGEQTNAFSVGTDLYGYDIADAGLMIIATQDNTKVRVINLANGAVTGSNTLNTYGTWSAAPGDGIYFKVESDKPVLAYESDFGYAHTAFAPSLESGPVGHQFTVYYWTGGGYYVFAYEDTVVTFFSTAGAQVAQKVMAAGTYWNPGLTSGTIYRVYSTGKISMQNDGGNSYSMVPSSNGDGVGRLFYASINGASTGGAFVAFAYENATVSVYDMDNGGLLWSQSIAKGGNWFKTGAGTRRVRIVSTGDIEVWAGDTEGGSSIVDLGDDISFASGRKGQEFYLNTLRDGAVIFAPYNNTVVNVDGTIKTLNANGYWHLTSSGVYQHITASKPVVIQTLGRANGFNDEGTYLGGRSAIRHYYNAVGTYNVKLTVYDNSGMSSSKTTTMTVGASNPPVADPGGPYVINESNAVGGVWTVTLDGSKSTDDYGIYKYEWDFDSSNGIQVDSTSVKPTVTYTKAGVYTVTLSVYDQALQKTTATTTVTVLANNPPVAVSGGPYSRSEDSANFGVWTVNVDGSRSSDDFGIYSYEWLLGPIPYNFTGTSINKLEWFYNAASQNNGISITGSGAWDNAYIFSTKAFDRSNNVTLQARVLPANMSGNQNSMIGFKRLTSSSSYTQMPYAVYFQNGNIEIYEDGTGRGVKAYYSRNITYDVKIVLKKTGANYYYKTASSNTWILLYDSSYSTASSLNVGMTVYAGTFSVSDLTMIQGSSSVSPTFEITNWGTYPLALTVTDNALQSITDNTTVNLLSEEPTADAGGPYSAEVGGIVEFNGSKSSDNYAIQNYEWEFGDTTGSPTNLPYTGKGVTAKHVYKAQGTYNVTLRVKDNAGRTGTDTTTVSVVKGNAPIANAGGPYVVGAGSPVYLDGSGSSDDFGIVEYRWDIYSTVDSNGDGNATNDVDLVGVKPFFTAVPTGQYFNENFSGSVIDTSKWISAGATQNDKITITGSGSWGGRYIFSQEVYARGKYVVFQGQVKAVSTSGDLMMWGLKKNNTDYSYTQMPHAIYFNGGTVYIYENGTSRGSFGTYSRGTIYDLKIELTDTGALYYWKDASVGTWTKIYESTSVTDNALKVGATVCSGTFDFDNFSGKGPDPYVITLTVEDGAGQTATATTTVTVLASSAPNVITVPWVAHDPTMPHETYNGKAIRLKGIVRDFDPATYQWDFGDGTKSAVLNVTNPYDLSISHTYPNSPDGTPFIAILTVWDSKGLSGSDTYNIIVKNKSLSVETNIAIDEGLWYLHQQQTRTTTSIYPSGYWVQNYSGTNYYASATASAIQAFEINGHLENGDNKEDPYVETVARGLKYLFTQLTTTGISSQTYGNPDTNGNGIGIGVNSVRAIYESGAVMDAIASSQSPLTRTVTGGTNIVRRTYFDVLTDMVDMFAWGQSDNGTYGGGWRYSWNEALPDNSAAQWGAIGMQAAEDIMGIPVPQWVKDRDNIWLNYSYDGTGFGYTSAGNSVATTPSGMVQLAFIDRTRRDVRWITAENYIASQWSPTNSSSPIYSAGNRNYYAMYAFTKAMRLANPQPVSTFSYNGLDWYNDATKGLARSIINDQTTDGRFVGDLGYINNHMRTAWGVIMLTQSLFVQPPAAEAGPDKVWGVNIPLTFDGSGSYHLDPFRKIVKYEWDFNGDGIFDSSSSSPTATHTYTDDPATLPKTYTVTLRVTDDNSPPLTDSDTVSVIIAVPPHPPVAVPGGPYKGTAGLPVALDGSGSFDIDPTDFISKYEWELNGVFPYDFAEATGAKPTYVWNTPGTYNIGLRVWDNAVMNDLNNDGKVDDNEKLSDQKFTTVTIVANEAPIAEAGGPYTVDEGTAVVLDGSASRDPNGDPIFFSWDLNNDGQYNDASGPVVSHTFMSNGTYTVGLKVTDTVLSGTDTATVIVRDLAPTAAFTWSPQTQTEGSSVSFTDQSTSYPDTIVAWSWDFGGKGSSPLKNPSFVFGDNGTYQVSLTVTDSDGSTNTVTHNVVISNVVPSVNAGPNQTINEGSTASFSGSFTDPSPLDTHTIEWNFGDGSATVTGTLTTSHLYKDNGVYTVTLTVTDDDGGVGKGTLIVTVNNVPPTVEAGPDQTVKEKDVVSFSGSFTDPGVLDTHTILWEFGDGATATGSLTPTHTYQTEGTYLVRLKVTDKDGGVGSDTLTITVLPLNHPPVAEAGPDQTVSEGSPVIFSGSFVDPDVNDTHTIVWNFGDGSAEATGTLTPQHTYANDGLYTVTLTVTDAKGASSSDSLVVTVNNAAPVVEAGPNQTINEGDTASFSGSFTDPGALDTHIIKWNFGDGSAEVTASLTPSHTYADNGTYTVTLTVTDNDGGVGSDTLIVTVNNVAPVVEAGPEQTINEGDTAFFSGSFTDPGVLDTHVYEWDFGDGSAPVSGTLTPSHTYADNGTYTVTLTVTDKDGGVGMDTLAVTVKNVQPIVEAGPDMTINEGDTAQFGGSYRDPGVFDTHIISWDFGDGSAPATGTLTPVHTYADNGNYTVTLTVTDKDGGMKSDTLTVTVNNVPPLVEAGPEQILKEGETASFSGSFTDPGVLDTHVYEWNFGDGSTGVSGTLTPSHTYADNGVYTVALTVTDKDGGVGNDTLIVTVSNVPPSVEAGPEQTINEGDTAFFNGSFTDPGRLDTHTTVWDFGDGSPAATGTLTPSHTYADNGTYTVTLTVKDNAGAEQSDVLTVTVNNVAPAVEAGPPKTIAEGETVSFNGSFTDPGILDTHTFAWSFGDGSAAVTGTLSPTHTYADNGVYSVRLTVTDKDGGVGQDITTVTVENAAPVVEAGPDQTINEGDAAFFSGSFTDAGVLDTHTAYWNFGDGSAGVLETLTPSHTYADNGSYIVTLTVTDKDGGVGSDTLLVTVNNVAPVVEAGPDQTINESEVVSFSGSFTDPGILDTHTFKWNFGDGSDAVTGTLTPSHIYADNGSYTVTLTVTDKDGGVGSDTLRVNVNNLPPVLGVVSGPNEPVRGGEAINVSAPFTDPGILDTHSVLWDWGDGTTSSGAVVETGGSGTVSGSHAYTTAGIYQILVTVTDKDGGYDSATYQEEIVIYDSSCSAVASNASNFNGTPIAAGNWVWFNSVVKVNGRDSGPAKIRFFGARVRFNANGTSYDLPMPDSEIVFSSSATMAETIYTGGKWVTTVPLTYTGNVFLGGLAFPVPAGGLPGGINPVTLSGNFITDTAVISVHWLWAAAVYTQFSSDHSQLGVKPVEGGSMSAYANSDHAGTPELFKLDVIGGARGGGGSNYTGSYSGTVSKTPCFY